MISRKGPSSPFASGFLKGQTHAYYIRLFNRFRTNEESSFCSTCFLFVAFRALWWFPKSCDPTQALASYWFMQAAQAGLDEAQYQISRSWTGGIPFAKCFCLCFEGMNILQRRGFKFKCLSVYTKGLNQTHSRDFDNTSKARTWTFNFLDPTCMGAGQKSSKKEKLLLFVVPFTEVYRSGTPTNPQAYSQKQEASYKIWQVPLKHEKM